MVIAPAYFELDAQGLAVVIKPEVDPLDEELLREAETGCPVEAILIER